MADALIWHWTDTGNSLVVFDMRCPIDAVANLTYIEDHLTLMAASSRENRTSR